MKGDVDFLLRKEMEHFERRSSHTPLHLPDDLVVEIFLRSPAKSVARFRCVSTTWLSISTDPSFILDHARRAPKSLLLQKFISNYFSPDILLSFPITGIRGRRLDPTSDRVMNSADGLVLFMRRKRLHSSRFYVLNILTGLRIDLPNSNMEFQENSEIFLFYHRWTKKYRVIQVLSCKRPDEYLSLDVKVLTLTGAYSWRRIEPNLHFSSYIYLRNPALVNDRLYWIHNFHNLLVFDILKETFSFMELPCSPQSDCGLVEIEESLCFWILHRDKSSNKNITIDIWTTVDDDDKWMRIYSMSAVDFDRCSFKRELFCINEGELLFQIDGTVDYKLNFLIWDIKSGKCRVDQVPSEFNIADYHWLSICKETLVDGLVQPHNNLTITARLRRFKSFICKYLNDHLIVSFSLLIPSLYA